MKSDSLLDYAVFQLSPKRSRCELFVSSDGKTEKLASGLVKPFVAHLKVAEEQAALSVQSIKLEIERRRKAEAWFTKGTLERFVRFVSTPEILEVVNTLDVEMSQLEAAQRLYSQGAGHQLSGSGVGGTGITAASDATKKELLRAIDVRLSAVKQDLMTACTRAIAAGFNLNTVSELQMFADQFGAHRLNEACSRFISLCERRPDLINLWKGGLDDLAVRSSYGSDMSIDEEPATLEQQSSGPRLQNQNHPASQVAELTQPPTTQQPKPSSISFQRQQSRESSVEKDDTCKESEAVVDKEKKEESSCDQAESIQRGQHIRRLSVQDRINLFESKQKESSGSGGKPVVGKSVELRRQSSDVPEKAVLRRWSGASDMSIDLSAEKKDTESPLCTPSSASASYLKSDDKKGLNLSDSASSGKPDFKTVPGRVSNSGPTDQAEFQQRVASSREEVIGEKQSMLSSSNSGDAYDAIKSSSVSGLVDSDGLKDQTHWKAHSKSSLNQAEDFKDKANSEAKFRSLPAAKTDKFDVANQAKSQVGNYLSITRGRLNLDNQHTEMDDQGGAQTQSEAFPRTDGSIRFGGDSDQGESIDFPHQKEDLEHRNQFSSQCIRASKKTAVDSGLFEGGNASRSRELLASQMKGAEADGPSFHPNWRSLPGAEEAQKKELTSSEKLGSSSQSNIEDPKLQKMKFSKKVSDPEEVERVTGHSNDRNSHGNSKVPFPSINVTHPTEGSDSFSTPPASLIQSSRQPKGNQLNDELKMKANELEKLFAEHKLRVPGDSSSSRRNRATESPCDLSFQKQIADFAPVQLLNNYRTPEPAGSSSYTGNIDASPSMKLVEDQNYGDALSNNFSELSFSEESRGKFYDTYMQKRNEKLREDWSTKRAEKESKLKAMQDSFERNKAEIKAKFSGASDGKDAVSTARWRAERLRSFNTHSKMGREQQRLDFGQSDDDAEDLANLQERKIFGMDTSFNDTSLGDDFSRNPASKKLLPTKSLSSSTPRTSAAPIPRSGSKATNIGSGRRKVQSENPLAQSVPNFSEMRKENTKPSTTGTKTNRPQLRNYARSKSTNEEMSAVKEEKSRRSQSLRKSYANPGEFREKSPAKPEDKEAEQSPYGRFQRHTETKSFKREGSGRDLRARTSAVKQKATIASDHLNNEEACDDIAFGPEHSADILNDNEEEEFVSMDEDHVNVENGELRGSQESENMNNSGSENGDIVRSFSYVGPSLGAELTAVSGFHHVETVQDSPGESPVSWNSRVRHPFPYTQETSDVDVSADSPVGSPMSWNSHSLSQMESDAARMRKKWGTAQKPMLVTNSSNNQSRKDMTRGFKRLLKFGRKSRGTENLVDWISATTSEGDDDTEDGRDPANRSSEDLRKSRMGLLQGHTSDDCFNESEFFNEQVQLRSSIPAPPPNFKLRDDHLSGSSIKAPRSFFSLSTFRSKGSDSKPR